MIRRARRYVSLAVLLIAATAVSRLPSPPHGSQQTSAPTPMELFQKMMPVIRHARCMNCHGAVDPRSAAHQGQADVLSGSSCETCHNDAKHWDLPAADHFFVGKSDKLICAQFAEIAMKMGFPRFLSNHLQGDELIQLAFVGLIGGARTPGAGTPPAPPADPPPMSYRAFVQAGRDWLNQGYGACDVEGTITQDESVHTDSTHHPSPTRDETLKQDATRHVEISFVNGSYRAQILVHGTSTLTVTEHLTDANNRPCEVTIRDIRVYDGTATGPATVRVKDTVYFADTDPARGQTDYRIDVTLPRERTRRINSNTLFDSCGSVLAPSPPDTLVTVWPAHEFTIEGHLEDRRTRNLTGGCDKVRKSGEVARDLSLSESPCFRFGNMGNHDPAWLMYREADGSYHDGGEIPVRVVTTWNIVYRGR